jgi:putative transcriptional regulator
MKNDMFDELVASVREGGAILHWEQGRRLPEGPARVLLQVAAKHPDAVWDVVRPSAAAKPAHSARQGKATANKTRRA